ncbi:MAG: hypothetical protein QXM08_00395 [Thermofilaceae archaeon]
MSKPLPKHAIRQIAPLCTTLPEGYLKERCVDLHLHPPENPGERTVETLVNEMEIYLKKIPVIKVELSYPIAINPVSPLYWDFGDEKADEPNLLYDYVIGHRSVPISLEEVVGSRYVAVVIRYPAGGQWMEEAHLFDIGRTFYFMKPDFIKSSKDYESGRRTGKSRRLIKFSKGWVRLYLRVIRLNSRIEVNGLNVECRGEHYEEKIKLLELELRWIGHTHPARALASNYREMKRIERKLGRLDDKHLFAKIGYRLWIRGRTTQGVLVKNIVPPMRKELVFGHQVIRVEDDHGDIPGVKVYEGSAFRLEPFNHTVRGEIIVRNKDDLDEYRFEPTVFTVHRIEDWGLVHYILRPKEPIGRIVIESGHHYSEGFGRILVELRKNQLLVFSHSRPVYIEVFEVEVPE